MTDYKTKVKRKFVGVVTSNNEFWKKQKQRFCKENNMPMIVNNINYISLDNNNSIKRICPKLLHDDVCSCAFTEIIIDDTLQLTDKEKIILETSKVYEK